MNNREIEFDLGIKENTIYAKLGVSNRVELVPYALSHREERPAELDPEELALVAAQ